MTTIKRKKTWPGMQRATADRLMADVLRRVAEVNNDDSAYAHRVTGVWVFGSYLKGSERPKDLDLCVALDWKYGSGDHPEQIKADEARREFRTSSPANSIDDLFWPQTEVLRFIKGGSARVSLHGSNEVKHLRRDGHPVKLVFGTELP